jgi:hypothetical protein
VRTPNHIGSREVRDRSGYAYNARSATTGQAQTVHCLFDQLCRIWREMDRIAFDLRVT